MEYTIEIEIKRVVSLNLDEEDITCPQEALDRGEGMVDDIDSDLFWEETTIKVLDKDGQQVGINQVVTQ
tara:strand:+ start:6728 stop:6934 length:207 start_codon:yes stop_codon:yes gene_type:complete